MYNYNKLDNVFMNISVILIIMCFSVINYILWQINQEIAIYFCSITKIPQDLSLTIFSIGYANNISVMLQLIEIFILYKIFIFIEKHF